MLRRQRGEDKGCFIVAAPLLHDERHAAPEPQVRQAARAIGLAHRLEAGRLQHECAGGLIGALRHPLRHVAKQRGQHRQVLKQQLTAASEANNDGRRHGLGPWQR
jgi:hypothetical protein